MKRISSGFCRNSERKRPPARKSAEETVERSEGRIRIFGSRELIDDGRDEFDQVAPRLLAAQRAVSARAPSAHRSGNFGGWRKPISASRSSVSASSSAPSNDKFCCSRQIFRRALEQAHIMGFDLAQMREQNRGKGIAAAEAEKAGEGFQRPGIGRQRVGLLVGHHLQPVLDAAQEIVSRSKLVARGGVDPAVGSQYGQHGDGARGRAIRRGGRRR